MVAYTRWRDSLCKDCGVIADLGMDPMTIFTVTDEVCYGCQVREGKEQQLRKSAEDHPSSLNGVKVWISKTRTTPNLKVVDDG